ncbi:13650_t:CDS:2 [Dentiscutata erythropus]|uniref:13650_t:CDS:1 n=1 Tax=Dentiscutata erythropus TaxID=1348616 RepID=A0A9N8W2A7_9GLOM|nr:13650_t:CDS:2 [Dentiscutata erythropus]
MIFGICRGCGNPNDDFNKCQSCEDWINEKTRVLQALQDLIAQRKYKINLSKSDEKSECAEILSSGEGGSPSVKEMSSSNAKNNQEHPDSEHYAIQENKDQKLQESDYQKYITKEQRVYTMKSTTLQPTLSSKEFTQAQEQKQVCCGFSQAYSVFA